MFLFGHIGITLGAAVLLNGAFTKGRTPLTVDELRQQHKASTDLPASQSSSACPVVSWLIFLEGRIDIRLLLIGSLLPDIIDKPISLFFFRDTFATSRMFCHTLLFLIVIALGGLYLYRSRKKTWLSVFSFGTFTHLILDGMWLHPQTLFWPLYGFSFQKICLTTWIQDMLYTVLNHPVRLIPEFIGLAIIIFFVWLLVHRGKLYAFVRKGTV